MASKTVADLAAEKKDGGKRKSPLYDHKKPEKKGEDGGSGRGEIGFNTPGRNGAKGGKTPSREEQPKSTMEALSDVPATLLTGKAPPSPKTSPGTTGKGGTPIDSGNGSTGPGGDAMGAMMTERKAMAESQEDERRDLHGSHRADYRKMQERHDAEIGGITDKEALMRAHRKHELERQDMQRRQIQSHQDMHSRHNADRMQMHGRHEDGMGAASAEMSPPMTDDEKFE